jgi:hypothetical protein
MTGAGVATFAELAFFFGFLPGSTEEVFNNSLALPLLGAIDHVQRPALRRLFTEAYTLSSADLQRRVEPCNELAAAQMPPAEREARLKALLARLPGLKLSAVFEPSHRAMDLAHEMYEINAVKHVDFSMCTTRRAELEGAKIDKCWKVDASGYLRERQELTLANVEMKDLLAFRQALTRRSIMLDVADITSFEAHEDWADLWLECVQAEQIPGFNRISIEQALRADKEIWHRIARTCRDGVPITCWGSAGSERLEKVAERPPPPHLLGPVARPLLLVRQAARVEETLGQGG